jgi:hypothetical protein
MWGYGQKRAFVNRRMHEVVSPTYRFSCSNYLANLQRRNPAGFALARLTRQNRNV